MRGLSSSCLGWHGKGEEGMRCHESVLAVGVSPESSSWHLSPLAGLGCDHQLRSLLPGV